MCLPGVMITYDYWRCQHIPRAVGESAALYDQTFWGRFVLLTLMSKWVCFLRAHSSSSKYRRESLKEASIIYFFSEKPQMWSPPHKKLTVFCIVLNSRVDCSILQFFFLLGQGKEFYALNITFKIGTAIDNCKHLANNYLCNRLYFLNKISFCVEWALMTQTSSLELIKHQEKPACIHEESVSFFYLHQVSCSKPGFM